MGGKCGKHAEVRTLSRRNSRQNLDAGALEAQIIKGAKKKDKKRRNQKKKGKWRLRRQRTKKTGKGMSHLPPEITSKSNRAPKHPCLHPPIANPRAPPPLPVNPDGAAWRVRTFSESSIQSSDYLSAEEDELSDVSEEITYRDEFDDEGCQNFFSLAGIGAYVSSFWRSTSWGSDGPRTEPRAVPAPVWDPRIRSLSKASRQLDKHKYEAGKSLQKATIPLELCAEKNIECERHCWDQPKGNLFPLRGKNYLKDRKKGRSEVRPVYELKSVDYYSSETRVDHIAQRLKLPSTEKIPEDCPVTPLLVINWQAPMYPAKVFGKPFDGESLNVVAVYSLRDGFVAEEEIEKGNLYPHTLELLKKFCTNARDEDGRESRERLKMIPAMPNLDEWCETKTFGKAEQAILRKWQNKPMLVRPQVKYYVGPEYIEVDINIHDYQYATRRYFHSLRHCLKHGVMDMALVLEGRSSDQLPEQVIGSIRLQKIDFLQPFPRAPPMPALDTMEKAKATTVGGRNQV